MQCVHLRGVVLFGLGLTCACTLLVPIPDDLSGGSDAPIDGATDGIDATNVDARDAVSFEDAPAIDASDADASWPAIGCGAPADPSLLAYYAFDDGAGATVKDCSGRGHAGAIVGTPSWTTGKYGGALSFNGVDNCVDVGAAADLRLTTFTYAAWANVADYLAGGLGGYLVGKTNGNPNSIGWRFSTVDTPTNVFDLKLAIEAGAPFSLSSPGPQAIGSWIHVGLVLAPGQRADIYVNGVRVANNATPPAIYEEVAAPMRLGCNGGAKDYFKGTLDEVRIYSRALSDAEMAALAR